MKGMLADLKDEKAEAENMLRQAIATAHAQGCLLFELRAAVCLAELLSQQNRKDEAASCLSRPLNALTEELAIAEVDDARDTLRKLETTAAFVYPT